MDALAGFLRVRRSEAGRSIVSWRRFLPSIALLCLTGCASGPIFTAIPQPIGTAAPVSVTPEPTSPLTRFPEELLRSSWQLEGVVVDGKMQPPWNAEQCMAVGYRPEEYYFYTGCNHGYCDPRRQASVSQNEPHVICALTLQGCVTTPDARGEQRPVEWERPFADAMMERRAVAVRDTKLWLSAEDQSKPALVFRRVHTCAGEDNYLRP